MIDLEIYSSTRPAVRYRGCEICMFTDIIPVFCTNSQDILPRQAERVFGSRTPKKKISGRKSKKGLSRSIFCNKEMKIVFVIRKWLPNYMKHKFNSKFNTFGKSERRFIFSFDTVIYLVGLFKGDY